MTSSQVPRKNTQQIKVPPLHEEEQSDNPASSAMALGRNLKTDKEITITDKERASGVHVLGGMGTGKSTLATGVFLGDIAHGHGGLFIDVDGDSINDLLPRIPQKRMDDVILLDLVELGKLGRCIGINPVTLPDVERTVQIFKMRWKIGPETPRLENTLHACLLTLAYNNLTIAEIPDLLEDAAFRKRCIDRIPVSYVTDWVRRYWERDYNKLPPYLQNERKDTILNKVHYLLTLEYMSYAISQNRTTIRFRELIQQKKIVLLRLSPKELGEETAALLGLFLMSELKSSLFSLADLEKEERPFFSLIADEWQLYITPDFEELLTRGRKYGLGAMVLNQSLAVLPRELRAITQQVNIHVTFRVGADDADRLAPYYTKKVQPGETRYEQIYEPEIIKSTKEIVTWEPPDAEQEYYRVEQEQASLQDELLEFRLLKNLKEAMLSIVFRGIRFDNYPVSLVNNRVQCNPDFGDLDIANFQKVIPAKTETPESSTRLPELFKKRDQVRWSEKWHQIKRDRLDQLEREYKDEYLPHPEIFLLHKIWRMLFQYDRKQDELNRQFKECDEEIKAELEADRRNDKGYPCIIPSSILSPIEQNLVFLLHADDNYFAQLKGSFYPAHTFTVEKEPEHNPENFFDRFAYIIPLSLQAFIKPEKEYETVNVPRVIPLTDMEKTVLRAYLRYLARMICILLNRRDEEFVFVQQRGLQAEIIDGNRVTALQFPGGGQNYKEDSYPKDHYVPDDRWNEQYAQATRFHDQRRSLDLSRYIYIPNHRGYWQLHDYPEIPEFVRAEIQKFSSLTFPKQEDLQSLERRRDALLRYKKVTYEEVTEYKSLTLNTGEVISPYFKQKYEKELKVSIGFSEGESMSHSARSGSRGESHGKSISISEDKIHLYQGKEGNPTRSQADLEKEMALELVNLPNKFAYVAIGSRGERYKPFMKTNDLNEKHPRIESLEKRRLQALANAYQYTTTIEDIEKQVLKRKLGYETPVAPARTPVETPETPKPLVKRRIFAPDPAGALPALSFDDDYLKLLYHFHYLTLEQICRLLGKTGKYDDTHVREDLNKLVEKGWITKEPITRKVKAGRVPLVYSLNDTGMKQLKGVSAGTRKGTFSDHTLQVNDALITLVLAAKQEPSIRLVELQHERYFKQHNIQVGDKQFLEPDGFLHFQLSPPFGRENESVGVCLEIDLGSEVREQWQEKVRKYINFASGIYQKQFGLESLTIAVCRPGGNTQLLRKWTEEELRNEKEYAPLFLFTNSNPVEYDPVEWLTSPVWTDINNTPYALIEKINHEVDGYSL